MLLVDYTKAFDRIDHTLLIQKLHKFGIPQFIISWITNFLTERQQCVKIGSIKSDWLGIKAGVPQGTKVGPVLFIIMINDLTTCCNAYKYVDDTTLVSSGNAKMTDAIQYAASETHNWSSRNKMAINPSKTKEILFDFSKTQHSVPPIVIDNKEIERVKCAKFLGVTLSADLSWETHIDNIYKKATQRVHYIKLLKRAGITPEEQVKVYLSIIRPTMEYACQVWHPGLTQHQSDQLETVQRRVLRVIHPHMTYDEALSECKVPFLKTRRDQMCQTLFKQMEDPKHKIHHLLPPKRDVKYAMRNNRLYACPKLRTQRSGQTFMPWALSKFQ